MKQFENALKLLSLFFCDVSITFTLHIVKDSNTIRYFIF